MLACYLLDTPSVASGLQTQGVPARSGNNTVQYPCTGCSVHTAGQSWMGFAWKLRNQLETTLGTRAAAIAVTEDIVVGSIVADATNQADAVLQVHIADDDDGNLITYTSRTSDIHVACNLHSLPNPVMPGPANDECTGAVTVQNGLNGPFSTVGSTTSAGGYFLCGPSGNDIWFRYYAGAPGTLSVTTCGQALWDTVIHVFSGSCGNLTYLNCNDDTCSRQSSVSISVTPGIYYIRVGGYSGITGSFRLDISGPGGSSASTTPFGTACGRSSKSFYELLADTSFDLGGTTMRLVRNANGFYVAEAGGSYVAPSAAATQLALTDDSVTTVSLAGAFPFPGGTTSILEVCSNGYVSAAAGNGVNLTPNPSTWLASPQPRWGTWHDFDPTGAGSGKVKFEQIGTVAYVTWQGVFTFGTAAANTWQLQFDRATGNVTYAWQAMGSTPNQHWLVGFAGAGPGTDPGNLDISAALPDTFRTGVDNSTGLVLTSSVPTLGASLTFTTTFPASSLLGIQILSTTRFDPGIDLSGIGMPGCAAVAALDVSSVLLPVAQQATYSMAIPNNPVLVGFQMTGQSAAFVNGVNSAGLVTSNGVAITVGF